MRSMIQALLAGAITTLLGAPSLVAGPGPEAGPLVHEVLVPAPRAEVWRALTTKEGIISWMAAKAEVDFKIGGKIRVVHAKTATVGDPSTIENTVLAYDPGRMYAIRATGLPAGFPYPKAIQRMWTVLYLQDPYPGYTRVTVVGLGFGSGPEDKACRAFFDKGNAATLKLLLAKFAPPAPAKEPAKLATGIAPKKPGAGPAKPAALPAKPAAKIASPAPVPDAAVAPPEPKPASPAASALPATSSPAPAAAATIPATGS